MSIEKLERVMWRLRKNNPDNLKPTNQELKKCIYYECGTSRETYARTRKVLIELGWIRTYNNKRVKITDKDLSGVDA